MNSQILQKKFYEMEEEGEVDESVTEEIQVFQEEITSKAENIKENLDRKDNFKLFFIVKTYVDIFEKMKERIEHAKERNDNPQVAIDSMDVLDEISKFEEFSEKEIEEKEFREILSIQTTARDNDLFPESEELKEQLSPADVESANRVFDNIRSNFGG